MSDADPTHTSDALLTLDDYARAAKRALSPMAWGYYSAGADSEDTLRRNAEAFSRYEIWYRVLVDVSEINLATTVLGTPVPFPVLIAPTAYHRLAHPEGELATARAAAALGVVYTASTLATTRLERVAEEASGPRWFQLYVHKDRGFTKSLVERARAAGYSALVLTVDTPLLGRRLVDERSGFGLPDGMVMENLVDALGEIGLSGSELARYVASRHDASLTFRDIEWLRDVSGLPIVLKGLVRGDDARRAIDVGVQGIIVSNHGGRQLDFAPATIDALPEVARAVDGRCEVYMDGGVRWGTDVLKALALGARAVMLGRPILWGLAVSGEEGVRRVLHIVRDELIRAMALAGCPDLPSIGRDLVRVRA